MSPMPGPGSLSVGPASGWAASVSFVRSHRPTKSDFLSLHAALGPLVQDAKGCGLSFGEQEARAEHKEGIKEVGGLDQMSLRHAVSSRRDSRQTLLWESVRALGNHEHHTTEERKREKERGKMVAIVISAHRSSQTAHCSFNNRHLPLAVLNVEIRGSAELVSSEASLLPSLMTATLSQCPHTVTSLCTHVCRDLFL